MTTMYIAGCMHNLKVGLPLRGIPELHSVNHSLGDTD